MRSRAIMLAIIVLVGLHLSASATLTLTKRNKFDLNWYFHNTSTKYTEMSNPVGYYCDYNSDGLPDYFFVLEDPLTCDWRLLAIDTRPTGGLKTLANRTAGRDIAAVPGQFVPRWLYTPFSPSMDVPDLVVVGTNQPSAANQQYTKFTFWRLNKYSTSLPTETDGTWSIDVVSSYTPRIVWPDISFNADDYPDFLIYHRSPSPPGMAPRQFTVTCYNGLNGAPLWARSIALDPQDTGEGLKGLGFGEPTLDVTVLPHAPQTGISGDFDANGKPEILLFYTFAYGDFYSTYALATNITMLKSSGNYLAPYSATWTRVATDLQRFVPSTPMTISDYNGDSFVDMMIWTPTPSVGTPIPPFQAYDLRQRRMLFQAQLADFGADTDNFLVFDHLRYGSARRADVTGDSWSDLDVYRSVGTSEAPLRIGLFHAWAGGGPLAGRRVWMLQYNSYNRAFGNANDFNGDDLLDYVLLKTPDAPNSPTLGKITYHIANTAVTRSGITLGKRFTYTPDVPLPPLGNHFRADGVYFSRAGDLDGDGMRDTVGSLVSAFYNTDSTTYLYAYGYLFFYDNTAGLAAPPLTAELEFRTANENWIPIPVFMPAVQQGNTLVDNNRDGFWNDVIVMTGEKAIWSFSYHYQVIGGPPLIEAATYADLDGNGVDAGDLLLLTLTRSVEVNTSLLRAGHFFLPVQGDSLGGTGFRVFTHPYNPQIIALVLGQGAKLTPPGLFSMSTRTSGSPSGIDFATTLPVGAIRSLDGISAVSNGAPDANDAAVDVRFNLIGRTLSIGNRGGILSAVNSADANYRNHKLIIPQGALGTTGTFALRPPVTNLGVPNVFQITQTGGGNFLQPVTIAAEFYLNDVNRELGNLLSEMRVHQLVEKPAGVFNFVPVHGTHRLDSVPVFSASDGVEKLNGSAKTVSVDVSSLNPEGSTGTPGLFAGLPIETVDERTIDIKPGSTLSGKATATLLIPGSAGAYTGHKLEFPGYVTTTPSDPNRLEVKIRTATWLERNSLTGGQSFPPNSGAIFVVTVSDALGLPVRFTDPVNVTVQFKERSDAALTDVVRFDGSLGVPQNMRIVRDYSADGVHFAFITGVTQTVNVSQGTVTAQSVLNLTDVTGMGTYGAVAARGATPVAHWELYP